MDFKEKFIKIMHHPELFWIALGSLGLLNWVSDERYLKIAFRLQMKKKLNLENPQTYSEKLQWLKLHDRNPKYTELVDKYAVREYIKNTIGEEYLIPLLGVWDKAEDINLDELPEQFVLKCNHDSGSVVICKDKASFDFAKAKRNLTNSLRLSYYPSGRE